MTDQHPLDRRAEGRPWARDRQQPSEVERQQDAQEWVDAGSTVALQMLGLGLVAGFGLGVCATGIVWWFNR